jgi:Methyltransferase FkbM domain
MVPKANHDDVLGRFREVISDPLNLLIRRVEAAGTVCDGEVVLHNGHVVPARGEFSYYDDFSDILVLNRGVHEPVEEFAFQSLLPHLPQQPVMLELGAMWAHYSMWMLQARPLGRAFMVEPDPAGLEAGRRNFARNGYAGTFEQGFVGDGQVMVDPFMDRHGIAQLTVLHSDIQGFEVQMLEGARGAFTDRRIDYAFVSTHGEPRHQKVLARLQEFGYRIEANSGFANDTTCHDGLVVAVRPDLPRFLPDLPLLGRTAINTCTPAQLMEYLGRVAGAAVDASTDDMPNGGQRTEPR